jgi:phosphopentomutase
VQAAGRKVHAIGKIGDIFSMQGIDDVAKGPDLALMDHLETAMDTSEEGSFTFANFVEFDSLYGHRRNVSGYARALEWFDAQLPRIFSKARPGDLLLFTADHGNDPTWIGTDHTRERVPVIGHGVGTKPIGLIPFTGVADLVADHLELSDD